MAEVEGGATLKVEVESRDVQPGDRSNRGIKCD